MATRKQIGFVNTNNKLAKVEEVKTSEFLFPESAMDNPYLQSIFKAVAEYLEEELIGNAFPEFRLKAKIEAARVLFEDEKKELHRTPHAIAAANRLLMGIK
ncbi:hypothetical protein M2459_001336 [Parabacteroides sp. PF5-5]|uniref:hypothetical protein n=1 Tax=unclassified Parabacteroides TaxID=2649774 RepID=UPI0024758ADE|nr:MULTISPECIES: hypothetical protein [unclassified Parabacteroides]MDH6304601.1 hypothetical protein [Parabacteroides sp. PH5-39]MDH6315786.1 hypothetical protein [Parabacteroides sp. PF5-13]MDH6319445.1 hypothetical protein [Parabacteroides sp. PH5-13]MDH6323176.1 hypothetical protein [Parabacteroides sp. PH5-8]MDH6326978.1 hypothetical protein [Parabacteroides sp. PH5-41]